ncbi:MAG: hypothetical protein ACRC9E_14655, partial [Plesiomonas shigelloides]
MFNLILALFFVFFQAEALADARPMTYNITMDYNSVTNQFENAKATGSATVQVSTSGKWPIEIRMQKDGITGLNSTQAGGGNHQIALSRLYTDFDFELRHSVDSRLVIPMQAYLDTSGFHYPTSSYFSNAHNNNCENVYGNSDVFYIIAKPGNGCVAKTKDFSVEDQTNIISQSFMFFGFDTLNSIRNELSKPSYKAGDYIGSVTYKGDGVKSRVGGRVTESYTFNFVITKKRSLTSFDFPNGNVVNFVVNKHGNQHVGSAALLFNVDGVFNASDKLKFTLISANSQQGSHKLHLKHATLDKFIPYNVGLVDMKVGGSIIFSAQNESKTVANSSANIFNGKLDFGF